MNSIISCGFISLCAFLSFESTAQRTDSISKKQVEVVDFKKDKTVTITYKDGSKETMSDNDANKKGLINNGGYGNQTTANSQSGRSKTVHIKSSASQPIYVLDGKEITEGEMKAINPSGIESINVLKDKTATDKYGVKGKNGVVEITMKSSLVKQQELSDDSSKYRLRKLIHAQENDKIISFTMTKRSDDEDVITVDVSGDEFTAPAKKFLTTLQPGDTFSIDKILIERNGTTIKLPSAVHTLSK